MEEFPVVSLDTLLGGEIVDRFKHEFERVVENIADPNTTLDKRSVVMTLTAKPGKSRQQTDVSVKFVTKLAPTESMETTVFISLTKRGLVASEYNPKQPSLPEVLQQSTATVTASTQQNVTQLRSAGGTA